MSLQLFNLVQVCSRLALFTALSISWAASGNLPTRLQSGLLRTNDVGKQTMRHLIIAAWLCATPAERSRTQTGSPHDLLNRSLDLLTLSLTLILLNFIETFHVIISSKLFLYSCIIQNVFKNIPNNLETSKVIFKLKYG